MKENKTDKRVYSPFITRIEDEEVTEINIPLNNKKGVVEESPIVIKRGKDGYLIGIIDKHQIIEMMKYLDFNDAD